MAGEGKITEKRLIEEGVYQIGQKIAKSLKEGNIAVNDINRDLKAFATNLEAIKKYALEFGKLDKVYKSN